MSKVDWNIGLDRELDLIETRLRQALTSDEKLLVEIPMYLLRGGGKRIRPCVTVLAYKVAGGNSISRIIPFAAAFELLHTASLIHDDIIDQCSTRRGIPTPYKKYGLQNALIAGDFLFVKSFDLGGAYGKEIVKMTAQACTKLAEGEMIENRNLRNININESTYLDIIERKTAFPISTGAKIGAFLADGSKVQIQALADYGLNLGMAFQIVDDILDVVGDERKVGKPIGSDISRGNLTILSIHALKHLSDKDGKYIVDFINNGSNRNRNLSKVLSLIEEVGSVEYARERAVDYANKAKEKLRLLPETKHKAKLLQLVDFVVNRSY